MEGVKDTVAGYTGRENAVKAPKYEEVCFSRDWVEGVRVFYDEDKLSYEELLDAFFETQEPKFGSRQYASIIFPHDEEQREKATAWLNQNAERQRGDGIPVKLTQIEDRTPFFQAEEYHQRYWQKTRPRIAGMIALLAISTGVLDSITPATVQSAIHTGANALVLAGLIFVLVERKIDTKVVQLD